MDGYGKWEHACAIALGLTSIAIGEGDAVGVVVATTSGDRAIPPRRRRDVLLDVAELFNAIKPSSAVSVADTLTRAASQPRVVVISDFLGSAERSLQALRVAAASGSEVFAVHVAARDELDPPERSFMAADPEEPAFQRAMSADNRATYLAAFASWRERVAGELHGMNASYTLTSTAEPVRDAVRRIITPGQ
jgi:uncharacterized protein (DUF58 family)